MINIAHPPVSSKPPLNKLCNVKSAERKLATSKNGDSSCFFRKNVEKKHVSDTRDFTFEEKTFFNQHDFKNEEIGQKHNSDCNQNVIEPNSCSFQQLCNMISDLEKNITVDETYIGQLNATDMELEIPVSAQKYRNQDRPEKDSSKKISISNGATYEDIMSFLGALEQDIVIPEFGVTNNPSRSNERSSLTMSQHPETLKENLATALLQLEDREATLHLLKNEMKNERRIACEKMDKQKKDHCTELQMQKTKYQGIVKRHQKFIEQLLCEKKDLTEKCNALAQRIKENEAKQQRELKCTLDRHEVELKRAKELCAASEKIRRERWLEAKTTKIKEMTVKGLEPELRSMIEQHQQEMQNIRSAHMKELQDVELRTIRRSNQQLEQLRLELTESHDKILSNEREALRVRFQEKFHEQETLLQEQQRKFFDELQQERKKFAEERARRDEERDLVVKQTSLQFQEKIDTIIRKHGIEKRTLEESLHSEREAWIENYRRQQSSKFEIAQAKILEESNRERERQIELAIKRLENEARTMKTNLEKSWENKLRLAEEKYDSELQDANERCKSLDEKLASTQLKLEDSEKHVVKMEERSVQCTAELNECRQFVDKLTLERDQAKRIARQEIESEKRELEDKIASLYHELTQNNADKDSLMAQLYSRIKLIVTQKDLSVKNIAREANDLREKCEHLEKLLDQQRKEYVLKSL